MAEKKEVVLNMPEIGSSKYKVNLREIEESVRAMNLFTDNLEDKVAMMLKGQETEFVNSYKNHMKTVQEALKEYQDRIRDYQKKIEYYENEGVLATLLNKISFLENHERQLLDKLDKKNRVILDLKGEVSTQNKEIQSLRERVKELLRNGPIRRVKEVSPMREKESERTFATEVPNGNFKSNQSLAKLSSEQMKHSTAVNPEDRTWKLQLDRAHNQLQSLKKRNRQLSSVNSRIIEKAGEVDQFFIQVLNQMKRKITTRKKFSECTFQDFRQEDKLELLVKILSSDDILQQLYHIIFRKQSSLTPAPHIQLSEQRGRHLLPVIGSARR